MNVNEDNIGPEIRSFAVGVVAANQKGRFYCKGKGYSDNDWLQFIAIYDDLLRRQPHKKVTIRQLADAAKISRDTAKKAMRFHEEGIITNEQRRRHGRVGVGPLKGFTKEHHQFLYNLYCQNPTRSSNDYIMNLYRHTGIAVSKNFITKWFRSIGIDNRSKVQLLKNTPENIQRLHGYFAFINSIPDHNCIVFANEKSYGMLGNSSIRCNIHAAVTIRWDECTRRPPVRYGILEDRATSETFLDFTLFLLRTRTLRRGDVFIVDNSKIHYTGECEFLQENLWEVHGISMVFLPAHAPELNPTKLVFDTVAKRMLAGFPRYVCNSENEFVDNIDWHLNNISYHDMIDFYQHCGYFRNMGMR